MFICVYVCINMYVYTHIVMLLCVYVCIYVYVCISIFICTNTVYTFMQSSGIAAYGTNTKTEQAT